MNKNKLVLVIIMVGFVISNAADAEGFECAPTPEDSLGPFYKPKAPIRSKVGEGYVISGAVKSAKDCSIVSGAKIEFWLAATDGSYDDDHRATVLAKYQPSGNDQTVDDYQVRLLLNFICDKYATETVQNGLF